MLTTQCGNGQDIFFDSTFTLELGLIEKRPARKTVDIFTLLQDISQSCCSFYDKQHKVECRAVADSLTL